MGPELFLGYGPHRCSCPVPSFCPPVGVLLPRWSCGTSAASVPGCRPGPEHLPISLLVPSSWMVSFSLILDPGQEFGEVFFLFTGILLHGHRDETGQRIQVRADQKVPAHREADPGGGMVDFLAAGRYGEAVPTAGRFECSFWRSVPG
jgi:hypothetical protein